MQSTKATCVVLPEVGTKPIDVREYNKEIVDVATSLTNIKDTIEDAENKMDYYTKDNIERLCNYAKGVLMGQEVLLLVGSKKVRFENELNQELECMKYMLVYVIMALKLLSKGGSLVLRTYDNHIPFTCSMLLILYKNFEQITIIKPLSSNLHSAVPHVVRSRRNALWWQTTFWRKGRRRTRSWNSCTRCWRRWWLWGRRQRWSGTRSTSPSSRTTPSSRHT
ncbi:MAG: hypothetical protein P4M11_08680 [Candidatus Pacebacteria bacterium]|nr:hypothetical protein [Candidatus Paceibacterota bacterium]